MGRTLTEGELDDIIFRGFCSIPVSEQSRKEREELILLVCEIRQRRRAQTEAEDIG
jgi:hypothetical protein